MTEVGSADLSRLLQSKRNDFKSIVTSRKRKLHELYAVATSVEKAPQDASHNIESTQAALSELQFLQANDILLHSDIATSDKKFDPSTIPTRADPNVDFFVKSLANILYPPVESKLAPGALPVKIDTSSSSPKQTPAHATHSVIKSHTPAAVGENRGNLISTHASPPPHLPDAKSPASSSSTVAITTPSQTQPVPSLAANPSSDSSATKPAANIGFLAETKVLPSVASAEPDKPHINGLKTDGTSQISELASVHKPPAPSKLKAHTGESEDIVAPPEAPTEPSASASAARAPSTGTSGTRSETDAILAPKSASPEKILGGKSADDVSDMAQMGSAEEIIVNTAEDQLLQESLQSAGPPPTVDRPEPIAAPDKTVAFSSRPTAPVSDPTSKRNEIPNSQEEEPDRMDVDLQAETAERPGYSLTTEADLKVSTGGPDQTEISTSQIPTIEQTQPAERAVTRVSSGTMRLKSVAEITGETPKTTPPIERAVAADLENQLTPVTSSSQSPFAKNRQGRPHSRGQVSTVLFGKQPKRAENKDIVSALKDKPLPDEDYFTPLFVQGFTNTSSWMQPMEKLLHQANKTIATPDALLAFQDHQACKVLRRVYHLQQNDKWSLRQPKRCPEPTRQASQWDVLLKEAKWMRTDFREERKWKMALAQNLARACAEWIAAAPEVRTSMQVCARIPPVARLQEEVTTTGAGSEALENHSTPELVPSADADSPQHIDELADEFNDTVAPSAIFALQEDDIVFGLRPSPTADRLLDELPMYGSPLEIPKIDLINPDFDPDAHWRRPALPLSKYVEGEMKVATPMPPRKRSRFSYDSESDDEEVSFGGDQHVHRLHLAPSSDAVSLFNPDMKHIRDRLHAGHQFRPPSEQPMPTQAFYEQRNPSQWTQAEDDELRSLVREYTYNWPLISGMLSTRSHFNSGAERRTPWECFERWINLEGLPADMSKTQYFKAYNSRIETAQRTIMQQNQVAAQQANATNGNSTPVRRRPASTPLRVERRRNAKYLTLIDAMRKLAKKREATLQKQQHTAAQSAANKKPIESGNQRLPSKTPRDYSLLRHERDQALAERMAQYAAKQEQQRRAALHQARAQQGQIAQAAVGAQNQNGQALPLSNQQIHQANGVNGGAVNGVGNIQRGNIPSHVAAAAAAAAAAASQSGRSRMPHQASPNGIAHGAAIQGQMNGNLAAPVAQMNGQHQMHAALQAQQQQQQQQSQQHRVQMANQQPDAALMLRAQRMAEQQRAAVQMQQAQHHPQQHVPQQHSQAQQPSVGTPGSQGTQGSPPMRNGVANMNQQNFINNAQAMIAQFGTNGTNGGHGSPPPNGLQMPSMAANSPGQIQARPQPQIPNSIAAQIAQLEATYRAKNPSFTQEHIRQLATENLTRAMMQQRQSAMNAAAGGAAAMAAAQPGIANGMAATTSPHQYAALLRQQQQQQQQQANQAAQSASPIPQVAQVPPQRQSSEGSTPSVTK